MPNEIIVRPRAGLLERGLERFGAAVKAVVPFSSYGGNSYGYGPLNGLYDRGLMNGSSPGATYDYATAAGNLLENSVVAACVDAIAQALSDAPVILEERDGDDWHPNHDHPVVDLLRQPNGFYGASHLWHATTASECTTGNGFWRIVKAKSTKQPAELWWEQSVGVQFDAEHFITRYILYVDGKPIPVENDDIIHFRHALNPQNPRLGWTPLSTVMRQIAGDNLAATYHGALLRNSGVPSLLVSPKQGDTQTPTTVLTPDQVQDLMQKLMAKLTGEGAGKIAGSSLPVSIDKMAYSPDEMAIDKLINYYTVRICATLRVPPMVAGFDDQSKTYANMGESIQDFWQRTIIPMQNRHANELNTQLLPLFGLDPADYRIGYDYSNVEVLQEDENAKWTMVGTAYKNQVIDRNEARVQMGYEDSEEYKGVFFSAPPAPGSGEPPETATGADKENGAVAETKIWNEAEHPRDEDGKFGSGSTGTIRKDGGYIYKGTKLRNGKTSEEGKVYRMLDGVEGIAKGEQIGDEIRVPEYRNIVSVDDVPEKQRKSLSGIVTRNAARINRAMSALSARGIAYNDPLQFGLASGHKLDLLDFSNASFHNETDALERNTDDLERFYKSFGADFHADSVRDVYDTFKGASDPDHVALGTDEQIAEAAKLHEAFTDEPPRFAYYSTNAREINIKGAVSTSHRDKRNIVLSSKPIAQADIDQWELTPVIELPYLPNGQKSAKSITLNGHEVHFMNGQQPETETKADGIDPTDSERVWTDAELEEFTETDVKFALGSSTSAMRALLRTQPNGNGDT